MNKELEGVKLEINNPTIEVGLSDFMNDTSGYCPGKDIYKQVLGKLLRVKIDTIEVSNAKLIVTNIETGQITFEGRNVSLLLTGVLIDSLHKEDSARILFSKELKASCTEILLWSNNGDYKYFFENLQFESRTNSFDIGCFKITPRLGEKEFSKQAKFQKDRYDFRLENISLRNVERESMWHKKIKADTLLVNKGFFKVFKDLSFPLDSASRLGKYPQQYLIRLPIPLFIGKIVFHPSFIEYKEKHPESDSSGNVQFYNVEATIDNVTNMTSAIARNNICLVHFKSNFLNKRTLSARLSLYLKNPAGKFTVEGSMGEMDAKLLNPLTQPMGLAKIDKGIIEKLNFNFSGNDYECGGKLLLLNRDLKISLLKKNINENKYNKRPLPSLVANILIMHSNPGIDSTSRFVWAHYNRNMHKIIFNLIWKTIYDGVKKSMGVNKK